jgi:hypothetical protein
VSAETLDDDPNTPPRFHWHRDRLGILRAVPPRYEARQAALRQRMKDTAGRRTWATKEMLAAEAAYRRWLDGRGPELSPDQMDAHRQYRRLQKARLARAKAMAVRDGEEPVSESVVVSAAADEIERLVNKGLSLVEIAEVRGRSRHR